MTDQEKLDACLQRLADGDQTARNDLIALAAERMRHIAHRMLRTFPGVKRWEQTDDVVQNASMRLYRALSQVTPVDSQGFIGLAATQIRRELLDLARKHNGPESYAANHETNVRRMSGVEHVRVNEAAKSDESSEHLARWTRLHEAAGQLPAEERQVFELAWYLGLKQEEICKLLGCSIRTVKRRWESVKELLASQLKDDVPFPIPPSGR